jgi:predicted nucleic acid-binding Zn finger protein
MMILWLDLFGHVVRGTIGSWHKEEQRLMKTTLTYERQTALLTSSDFTALDFATNRQRDDVSFRARVADPLRLRQLLKVQHACLTSAVRGSYSRSVDNSETEVLDPIVSVHPDQVTIEAFSNEGSCYTQLVAPMEAFVLEETPRYGTTTLDFSWNLDENLHELRSSRSVTLNIGGAPITIPSLTSDRILSERTVDISERWLRGFLQVQGALALHPFFFGVRPIDLLSIIAFLEENYPPNPPQGLRYEMKRGEAITVVLEPWDKKFILRGTHYSGFDRVVRVWGRRRLSVLRDILPYTDRVAIGVLGRGLPHIYICHCGPYRLLVALSGWTSNDWGMGSAFDLMAPLAAPDPTQIASVTNALSNTTSATRQQLMAATNLEANEVEQVIYRLCRSGKVMFDMTGGTYRLRELVPELDSESIFASDPRLLRAQQLIAENKVELKDSNTGAYSEIRLESLVHDSVDYHVSISIDRSGRLRYGRCECPFFQANMLMKGPCEHMLATRLLHDSQNTIDPESVDEDEEGYEDEEEDDGEDIPF